MKVIFLLLAVAGFLVFDVYLVLKYPYQLYQEFIDGGVDRSFIKERRVEKSLLKIEFDEPFWFDLNESKSLWIDTHFLNYRMTLPNNHPLLRFRPIPKFEDNKTIASLAFTDNENRNIFVFEPGKRTRLNLSTSADDLFTIDAVENYIFSKSRIEVLRDVFKKDLDISVSKLISPFQIFDTLSEISPLELAYNIHIYQLRKRILDINFEKIYFFNPNSLLLKIKSNKDDYDNYIILTFEKGYLYKNKVTLYKNDKMSYSILNHFSKRFSIVPSRGVESARKVYSRFSVLPFKRRLTTQGVALIYSSWTHELDNPRYIQELIYFLERGDSEKISLLDVYSYARNRWGSNFSTIKELRDESLEVENQRILEENERQAEKYLIEDESALEQKFKSDKDKLDYLLKRAKGGDRKKRKGVIIKD